MRALAIFVSGLFIIVAFLAATTERRELPTAAVPTTDAPAPHEASTVRPESPVQDSRAAATGLPSPERSPAPASVVSVEGITVHDVAARIRASDGRPSIVILYGTGCPLTKRMFADFAALTRRHPEVQVLAYETDEENAEYVQDFLREHGAAFPAIYVRRWPDGDLTRAMAPFGIQVGTPWTRPLVAVRDAGGRIIAQGQGVTNVAAIEQALGQLR